MISILIILSFATAIFMGMNIGGNNAAASMGAAYGAKARTKLQAVALIGFFSLLGAVLSGGEVIKTIEKGILPQGTILIEGAIIAVGAAGIAVFLANMLRVPISTSQAAVGAVVGIGLIYSPSDINTHTLENIVLWWVLSPIAAWVISYLAGKYLYTDIILWIARHAESEAAIKKIMNFLLTISGSYVAYSAGANNAANAIGPFVGAGIISPFYGSILAGLSLGVGAFVFGGRVLDTVGKDITELCVFRATFVEFISAGIVHAASMYGIPVSLGEIVTASVIGIGCANHGLCMIKGKVVKKIALAWVVSPLLAGMISYSLMKLIS